MDTRVDKEDGWVLVTPESTALDCFERDEWKSGVEWAMETDLQNPRILYYMGHCFEFGLGGENKDLSKAFYWYKASAEKGDADGQCSLGCFYEFGIGTAIDFKEAFRWYKAAAENGNTLGQVLVGLCYKLGKGTAESIEEAFRWYKTAADNGDAWGLCNLGGCYELGEGADENADEAFRLYKMSAENGDACGQYNLGRCYELGIGAEKDSGRAFKWYSVAAEHGDETAKKKLNELGNSTYESSQSMIGSYEEKDVLWDVLNTLTDRERQIVDFRFGISDGICRTVEEVARLFNMTGERVMISESKALRKLKQRLVNGNAKAQFYLGMMYGKRQEGGSDKVEAAKWCRMAATQGHEGAKKLLLALEKEIGEGGVVQKETPVQGRQKDKKMKKPSIKKAYNDMNSAVSEVFEVNHNIDEVEMNDIDDYLYCLEMIEDTDENALLEASNELFHRIGVLKEERNLALNEESEYCAVHRNEHSGRYFVLFNHPVVMERGDCGDTVKEFGEAQRKAIAEEESHTKDEDKTEVEVKEDSTDYDEWEEGEERIKQIEGSSHGEPRSKRLDCSREDAAVEEAKRLCGIADTGFCGINLYCFNIMLPLSHGDEKAVLFANRIFHSVGVLDEDSDVDIGEGSDFCELIRDDEMGCYCVIFNHHQVVERDDLYEYSVAALREEGESDDVDE